VLVTAGNNVTGEAAAAHFAPEGREPFRRRKRFGGIIGCSGFRERMGKLRIGQDQVLKPALRNANGSAYVARLEPARKSARCYAARAFVQCKMSDH